ncbi:hydrogen peroxide-inducible genes activator [Rhodospirillum rubrum]|uniref:Transcriptional regulator, LysR family n=1 Tax=Rhodospirillum rubrum (strain ATCC 11170 / ATH 1.1.1 / DSM 467 / LMG 4362 / NCIMB 8255 / S1) TaxID=269796 RepID=Q2RQL6_RHORT|nr:hydrogen peroxide-inducible genes activator [Rhodospirillum rubrum]ABC23579.1 transcriptional regulator, LysR family [Rhodospirillum rubrum ATCC 11170]AEO49317.1 LysR family transcriptional regulator [Rhodospirillum rubrum F11]MBK5955254.1 hydrogen peroxide-inducible genes activator [Rhodospirillum rubrum]QXG79542.1 hydrogen peroxide-inducible genes activator [Rhodospirillum rubrum]HAQ01013.1 hydrogen peroxide-inducible genes activator [Rhodospirillum rubrum]
MFTLRQLRYIVAVADTLNFRRAAEVCLVSQPTLSVQIAEVEAFLGLTLFERTRRSVVLTPIGREIAERARGVLREANEIVDLARSLRAPLSGPLRLGVIATLGPYLLPYVLSAFREKHPSLRLYLREDPSLRLERRLRAGELDLILVDMPIDDAGLDIMDLFFEPLWLAAPPDHALADRTRVSVEDLAGRDLLLLEEGHCLRDEVLDLCRRVGAREHGGFQATSLDTLRQMVASRIGLALLPDLYVAAEAAQDPNIRMIPFSAPPVRRVGLAWRKTSARVAEFREFGAFILARLPASLAVP